MTQIFSSRLHKLRDKAGMSQKELAISLKVAPSTLSNYENGIYLPPLAKAIALAKELGTSLDYLCGLTDICMDTDLLSRQVEPDLTFYQLAELIAALDTKERTELLTFRDYLKYKRTHNRYSEAPKIYKVAEPANPKKKDL